MSKSSLSNIVTGLMEQGIVLESEIIEPGPKGGRRDIGLTPNRDHFHLLGIEIRSDSYTVLSVDLDGTILFSETVETGFTAATFSQDICTLLDETCSKLEWLNRPLLGVGIGISGVIDTENQIILRSVSLDFHKPFDFKSEVASKYPFPIILENDANCGAWGEVVFQQKRKMQNFIFVLIEFWKGYKAKQGPPRPTIGIGFGFDGKIYRGSRNRAGEFKSVFNRNGHSFQQVVLDKNIRVTDDCPALRSYIAEICDKLAFLINTHDIGNVLIGGAALVLDKVLMDLEPLNDQTTERVYPLFHLNF